MGSALRYNERAWAIDVITEANRLLSSRAGAIRRAGGESSLSAVGAQVLFPDVLLYGAVAGQTALQGWELKFPDTPISDSDLISNAITKADRLRTDSFVLWNVTTAQMWVRGPDGVFACVKTWNELCAVTARDEVQADPAQWAPTLEAILLDVESHVRRGELVPPTLAEVLGPGDESLVPSIVRAHLAEVGGAMQAFSGTTVAFRDDVEAWWRRSQFEYLDKSERGKWTALAGLVISGWMNRFTLAHLLRPLSAEMDNVIDLPGTATPDEAMSAMHALPVNSDFATVFGPWLAEGHLTESAWTDLLSYNALLRDASLASGAPPVATGWFHEATSTARAHTAGQFATPRAVAELLAALAIDDVVSSDVLDPCCGTGTIARAVFDLKRRYVGHAQAYEHTWLSDKFAYPLQSAHLAMVDATAPHELIRIFQADVFSLRAGAQVNVADPMDGGSVVITLPAFDVVLTNAPFVRFETYADANPSTATVSDWLDDYDLSIPARADLYAYVLAQVWQLLRPGGRAGVVTSNSWLATGAGATVRGLLRRLFDLELVVVSGQGRWFPSAQVVTTILVLRKRSDTEVRAGTSGERTRFATTLTTLDIDDASTTLSEIASEVRTSSAPYGSRRVRVREQSADDLDRLDALGLAWTAAFADTAWLSAVVPALVPVASVLDGSRGERGGANEFFYPEGDHGIEDVFLTPILRRPREVTGLDATPRHYLFQCAATRDELVAAGYMGALAWIDRHAQTVNAQGVSLSERLSRSGAQWYEHRLPSPIDFVTLINPDERFFFARVKPSAAVDQRFVCFTARAGCDRDLCHALLSCTLTTYFLAGLGFGRGQGVLDLNATTVARGLRIFDPAAIDDAGREQIASAFAPLLTRDICQDLATELDMPDRRSLDLAVMGMFGLEDRLEDVHAAILEMHAVRKAALA